MSTGKIMLSAGNCPDCSTRLGDPDDERVARNFCRGCRRYWTLTPEGASGVGALSGMTEFYMLPDGGTRPHTHPPDEVLRP